jgi:hypothetical protein
MTLAFSVIPDAALAALAAVLIALVRVVWTLHGRVAKLEDAEARRRRLDDLYGEE